VDRAGAEVGWVAASGRGRRTRPKPDEGTTERLRSEAFRSEAFRSEPFGATSDLAVAVPPSIADLDAPVESSLARMMLARARLRAISPLDLVSFVAACPACGADCEWTQERMDTRVRSSMDCPCQSGPNPAHSRVS
jgi:hypothetical protein